MTVADAATQINASTPAAGSPTAAEMQAYIDALSESIDFACGPTDPQPFVERVRGGSNQLLLSQYAPTFGVLTVTAIVSLIPGVGSSIAVTDCDADPATGVVTALTGAAFYGPQLVTYTAGRSTTPPGLNLAARIIFQHLWETQRGGGSIAGAQGDDDTQLVPGFAFAVPNRAVELMRRHRKPAGIA